MASLIVVERALVKDGDQTVFRLKFDFATNYRVFEHSRFITRRYMAVSCQKDAALPLVVNSLHSIIHYQHSLGGSLYQSGILH